MSPTRGPSLSRFRILFRSVNLSLFRGAKSYLADKRFPFQRIVATDLLTVETGMTAALQAVTVVPVSPCPVIDPIRPTDHIGNDRETTAEAGTTIQAATMSGTSGITRETGATTEEDRTTMVTMAIGPAAVVIMTGIGTGTVIGRDGGTTEIEMMTVAEAITIDHGRARTGTGQPKLTVIFVKSPLRKKPGTGRASQHARPRRGYKSCKT